MSMINFRLSYVEHEKSFITSGPDKISCSVLCVINRAFVGGALSFLLTHLLPDFFQILYLNYFHQTIARVP